MFRGLILIFIVFGLSTACGRFEPFSDKVENTSDGSFLIETALSDAELLDYGLEVVYRFRSLPNAIAVKSLDFHRQRGSFPSTLALLPKQNAKKRNEIRSRSASMEFDNGCLAAYCEAGFARVLEELKDQSISLTPVSVAIIDSGVVPATLPIERALYRRTNLAKDDDVSRWSPHATMIASIFAGLVRAKEPEPENVYAPNARLHSIKITFANDTEDNTKRHYGSMQLAVALDTAIASGAKIVNLSLSYTDTPDENVQLAEQVMLAQGAKKGVLFVVAAGNGAANVDQNPVYPASYNANNLIVVGSHTAALQRASSSNYGSRVDITAQGASVFVNDKRSGVSVAGGTSFAAPIVASALSLYFGLHPERSVEDTLKDLFSAANTTYAVPQREKRISRFGRLDVQRFLQIGSH